MQVASLVTGFHGRHKRLTALGPHPPQQGLAQEGLEANAMFIVGPHLHIERFDFDLGFLVFYARCQLFLMPLARLHRP